MYMAEVEIAFNLFRHFRVSNTALMEIILFLNFVFINIKLIPPAK